jgi:hypothetical protein
MALFLAVYFIIKFSLVLFFFLKRIENVIIFQSHFLLQFFFSFVYLFNLPQKLFFSQINDLYIIRAGLIALQINIFVLTGFFFVSFWTIFIFVLFCFPTIAVFVILLRSYLISFNLFGIIKVQ